MGRPTIEKMMRRKRALEEAKKAESVETFKACLGDLEASDLNALSSQLFERFSPSGAQFKKRRTAIVDELYRRGHSPQGEHHES